MASDLQSDHARTYVFSDVETDQFQYFCQDKPVCTKFSVSLNLLYSLFWVRGDFFFLPYDLKVMASESFNDLKAMASELFICSQFSIETYY